LIKRSFVSRLINRFWVKSHFVPQNPLSELGLDLSRPIIYVVDQNSASDLLSLQSSCAKAGLPDPYQPIKIHGKSFSAVIYLHDYYFFKQKSLKHDQSVYLAQYQQILNMHQQHAVVDLQIVPVTFFWGRNPGKKNPQQTNLSASNVSCLQKAWSILRSGQDHLVRFNAPISIKSLLEKEGSSDQQAYKLARVALQYFNTQRQSARGPQISNRKIYIKRMLESQQVQLIIKQQCQETGLSKDKVTKQCEIYLKEISSHFSYRFLRFFHYILTKVWNGLYHGIQVNNAQVVRDATQSGAEIIYMPCHRSHMDYLLLSYLLYDQGVVPPHVAAGVNLNFFPAGSIFRRSGAFFLRRTFKDDPFYGKVFKVYLSNLFKKGYPIEFFTEGGRSRTGRLLPAKTGLLAISAQTFLEHPQRNVMIIPVYIGYDHIMEVSTYMKELSGQKKQQENAWQVLGIFKKLQHFGRAFVNFGEPINLKHYFDQHQPQWRQQPLTDKQLNKQVQHLGTLVLQGINQATAVNALPLCAAILLTNPQHQIHKLKMLKLLKLHQNLLVQIATSASMTYPKQLPEVIYQQALAMNKFSEQNSIVSCDQQQSRHLTYYRNTIVHVFALISLISYCLIKLNKSSAPIQKLDVVKLMSHLSTFVEEEYFLKSKAQPLAASVDKLLEKLQSVGLLSITENSLTLLNVPFLHLLSAHLSETRLRYHCILSLLVEDSTQSDQELMENCQRKLVEKSIEPFDQKVINVFIKKLDRHNLQQKQIIELLACLSIDKDQKCY